MCVGVCFWVWVGGFSLRPVVTVFLFVYVLVSVFVYVFVASCLLASVSSFC